MSPKEQDTKQTKHELPQHVEGVLPIFQFLKQYHQYEVNGLGGFPASGPVIVACTHALATYDMPLLAREIFEKYGRIPKFLIDRNFFKIPFVGDLMEAFGSVEAGPKTAEKLLKKGEIIIVAPGGTRELLRPSGERYQFLWENRKGFVRLAMQTGAPIVLAACPKADDVFTVYKNPITKFFYEKFRFPVFIARGLGPSPFPRKVRLTHFLSRPILLEKSLKKVESEAFQEQLEKNHRSIVKKMENLVAKAVRYRPDDDS
jgi:1-acyl-sn-glycerol-3-phosphate acyltransferase